MKKQTYKTKHPTIKKISIGDQFITNCGLIGKIYKFDKNDDTFQMKYKTGDTYEFLDSNSDGWYCNNLKYLVFFGKNENNDKLDIKCRYISLKDKIDLL